MTAIILPSGTSTPSLPSGIKVRPRVPSDIPALCSLLERQQPSSLYPIVWPLSMPVTDFIARSAQLASFVAEGADGKLLGHVAVGSWEGEKEITPVWAAAHGCKQEEIRIISVLFTDPDTAGTGVGSALFRAATQAALKDGGRPALIGNSAGPLAFYQKRGWKVIGEWDADWVPGEITKAYLMILPVESPQSPSSAQATTLRSATSAIVLPSAPASGMSTPKAPNFTIRRRIPADVPPLCDLLERQQPISGYPIGWPLPIPTEDFIARPGEIAAFVAVTASGEMLGHVSVRSGLNGPEDERELTERLAAAHGCLDEDVRVIGVLFTDPEAAGTGVGSALFKAATAVAVEGGGKACLDVVANNAGPLAFYQKRGWKIAGEWSAPWVSGKETLVYLMILPTDPSCKGGSAIVLPSQPPSGAATPARSKITVRPRRPEDMPALAALLERQQPSSLYPVRWPLPMPTEEFINRKGELASFVAVADGEIVGHVAMRNGLGGPPDEEELTERWAAAHGCKEEDVRVINVLFTDPKTAGMGVGSALFKAITAKAINNGGRPCLDVVATNTGPLAFYQKRGWKIVGEWNAPWVPGEIINVYLMILPVEVAEAYVASSLANGTFTPSQRTRLGALGNGAQLSTRLGGEGDSASSR